MNTLKWICIMPVIILIDILLYLGGIFSTRIRAAYLLSVCKKYEQVKKLCVIVGKNIKLSKLASMGT